MTIREEADQLLYACGLLDVLGRYGEPVVTGSCAMDMMAWRDLDLYIVGNDTVSAQWFALQQAVCDALQPVKAELLHEHGKLFLGLETEVTGTRWNVDIWAKDRAAAKASLAYCAYVRQRAEADPAVREAILSIKSGLIERKMYGLGKSPTRHYHSDEIYTAVLEEGVRTVEALLEKYPK